MRRTHTCGELTIKDIGKEVTLLGWVHKRRDHGKLIFIDIRDREGITQVVFSGKDILKKAEGLASEYVIKVIGKVEKRPNGTENTKIKTGEIEVLATELEIINISNTPPFEIDDSIEASEEVRLKYRFLDLRRSLMQKNLILRHRVFKAIRDFLDREGFIEVETPILTKSTPEGARDYLVPSRMNWGKFYALPQSPQLFKQLLMVSGLERYFQIARCFRDEDLRADRQPEFTQLDMELSFVDEDEIFDIVEHLVVEIFKISLNIYLSLPFPRISYQEAMERFNTDKPDIRKDKDSRNSFEFLWVVNFPLFKYNEEEKRWDMEHHPFTSPLEEDIPHISDFPEKVRARAYDLVVNGTEVASGSIRVHRPDLQKKIFERIGLTEDEIEKRFGFLLEAFSYGAPPHGGIAFGLDRLVAIMLGCQSIRDVIAFPKTQKAVCPLTDAPSEVDERQLRELGIYTKK